MPISNLWKHTRYISGANSKAHPKKDQIIVPETHAKLEGINSKT